MLVPIMSRGGAGSADDKGENRVVCIIMVASTERIYAAGFLSACTPFRISPAIYRPTFQLEILPATDACNYTLDTVHRKMLLAMTNHIRPALLNLLKSWHQDLAGTFKDSFIMTEEAQKPENICEIYDRPASDLVLESAQVNLTFEQLAMSSLQPECRSNS